MCTYSNQFSLFKHIKYARPVLLLRSQPTKQSTLSKWVGTCASVLEPTSLLHTRDWSLYHRKAIDLEGNGGGIIHDIIFLKEATVVGINWRCLETSSKTLPLLMTIVVINDNAKSAHTAFTRTVGYMHHLIEYEAENTPSLKTHCYSPLYWTLLCILMILGPQKCMPH